MPITPEAAAEKSKLFGRVVEAAKKTFAKIDNQITVKDHPELIAKIKSVFPHNFEEDNNQCITLSWRWRELSRDDRESYYSDINSGFKSACEDVRKQLTQVIGDKSYDEYMSDVYGSLTIEIPYVSNALDKKMALVREMVTYGAMREEPTDNVKVIDKSILLNPNASDVLINRIQTLVEMIDCECQLRRENLIIIQIEPKKTNIEKINKIDIPVAPVAAKRPRP